MIFIWWSLLDTCTLSLQRGSVHVPPLKLNGVACDVLSTHHPLVLLWAVVSPWALLSEVCSSWTSAGALNWVEPIRWIDWVDQSNVRTFELSGPIRCKNLWTEWTNQIQELSSDQHTLLFDLDHHSGKGVENTRWALKRILPISHSKKSSNNLSPSILSHLWILLPLLLRS